jgi:hypothetical protein
VTDATFWSDAASLIQIKDGATVVWEGKIAANETRHVTFTTPLAISANASVSASVVSSTADCAVNMHGYSI